jgi:hypothetical protein
MMSENKINDEKLEQVTGGYVSNDLADPDCGKDIICKTCGQGDMVELNTDIAHSEKYHCKRCDIFFNV